jgi:hypothetical protein
MAAAVGEAARAAVVGRGKGYRVPEAGNAVAVPR